MNAKIDTFFDDVFSKIFRNVSISRLHIHFFDDSMKGNSIWYAKLVMYSESNWRYNELNINDSILKRVDGIDAFVRDAIGGHNSTYEYKHISYTYICTHRYLKWSVFVMEANKIWILHDTYLKTKELVWPLLGLFLMETIKSNMKEQFNIKSVRKGLKSVERARLYKKLY